MAELGAELLGRFLADRDAACPQCSYNLRGLLGEKCPECGQTLQLQVGLTQPKLGALISGLIGLSAGAGLNGLMLVYVALEVWRRAMPTGFQNFVIYHSVGLMIEGGALAAWLVNWPKIARLPEKTRWLLASGCWFLALANAVAFWITMQA
jgi:DNA-directed RNA polymerase subunit RPC12/RpoP